MENILRECADRLIAAANNISPVGGVHSSTATRTVPAPEAPIPVTTRLDTSAATTHGPSASSINGSSQPSTALDEHRRIFGYRPPATPARPSRRLTPTGSRIRSNTPYSRPVNNAPRNTFTKAFVCLSKINQVVPPNAAERISLSLAGLGECKVVFQKDGSSQHVHDKILETFPPLKDCGGYELLRTSDGNTRQLIDVPCPPKGYDANFLKSALGQAKAFLRPLQQNLPLEVEQPKEAHHSPKVPCVNCHLEIAMAEMKTHQSTCGGGPSSSKQESGIQVQAQITDFTIVDEKMTNEDRLQELQQLFPHTEQNVLNSAITAALGDVNKAANSLLLGNELIDSDDDDILAEIPFPFESSDKTINKSEISISSIISRLSEKLTGQYLKVNTDDEDLLSDAVAVYKDPKFDPSRPLRIVFTNQPAIDTGGPRREFYEKVFSYLKGQ